MAVKTWHYVISEKCNLQCKYCNVDVDNNIRLNEEYFYNFYQTIKNKGPYIFNIFGGEPFMQLDIIKFILKIIQNDQDLISINITTNGTIYNDKVKYIISHPKVFATISYDGILQQHNRGTNKLFIKELRELGATIGHCMITGNDFETDEEYLIDNHINITDQGLIADMTLVRDIDSWTNHQVNNFLIDYKKYINFIKSEIDTYPSFKSLPGLIKTYLNPLLEFHMKNNSQNDCGCGTSHMAVIPDGRIVPCERFVRTDSINLLEHRNEILKDCNTCDIKDICHKGCIYEQLQNNGPITELCDIYKGINLILKDFIRDTEYTLLKLFAKENM